MDGGQLLACSLASGGEQVALGWPMPAMVLLGTWMSLALVHRDPGPRLWRLEEQLAGLSKDLEHDCWLERLEGRRDWLLQEERAADGQSVRVLRWTLGGQSQALSFSDLGACGLDQIKYYRIHSLCPRAKGMPARPPRGAEGHRNVPALLSLWSIKVAKWAVRPHISGLRLDGFPPLPKQGGSD